MRASKLALALAATLVTAFSLAGTCAARDLEYLKSKPYDQLTAAELTAA